MSPSHLKNITWEIKKKNLIVRSPCKLKILSSALLNPESGEADTIINHQIPQNFQTRDYRGYLQRVVHRLDLNPDTTVGLLTAAKIENAAIKTLTYNNLTVTAFVTGGLSNPASAGDNAAGKRVGTINIIVLTNGRVTNSCLVNIVQTATEAKTHALQELDVRSRFSQRPATGTTSDAIIAASTMIGPPQSYAGTASHL
ncbi:MAG: adenosylcobinamide amidohydrolase, partial [Candidatus Hodarchaeota archaeon]